MKLDPNTEQRINELANRCVINNDRKITIYIDSDWNLLFLNSNPSGHSAYKIIKARYQNVPKCCEHSWFVKAITWALLEHNAL